jgi:serine/threonine protein kinase/Tol biopolymer transport system component
MGEVYRARDHRLQRDVALKVLPVALSRDPDRMARFAREARTLAALSHPNIAIIYDLEEDGETRALVMELVEGATLADRVTQGALPIDEAIHVALQIADGLEAAHEQGIIHRDLKPANVKIRPDGTVKVLDFGLAKALLPADVVSADASHTSTVTDVMSADALHASTVTSAPVTSAGMILGTAAYMSPEQARGRTIDTRADIWAFGCVLYEMLTGRGAFAGETMTDVLAAILNSEPDWSALPPALPPSVHRLLRRCLEKNPRNRLRDIGDARLELRSTSITDPVRQPAGRETPLRRGLLWFSAGAAVAAGILSIYVSSTGTPERSIAPRRARVVVALPPGVTLALRPGSAVALAPDGSSLAYTARKANGPVQLYLRTLDRYESVVMPGTDDASHPFFSPDGRWVGFFAGGKLKKVLVAGGAPVPVADVRLPRGEAWTADDAILVTPANTTPLSRVPAAGGPLQPFSTLVTGELSHRWPTVLPNGTVLFSVWNDTDWEPARIAAQRPGTKEHVVVVERGGGFPRYLPDPAGRGGYLVYARSEGLLAAPFDEKTLKLTAQPVPVVDGVVTNVMGGAHFAVAADGTLAYVAGVSDEAGRELVWLTPDGRSTPALRAQMGSSYAVSPDGRLVARIPTAGPRSLWIEDLVSGTSMRLTESSDHFQAIFSRDGSRIASRRGEAADIFIQRLDRRGAEEQLTTSRRAAAPGSFSPGDAELAYHEVDPVTLHDIWVIGLPESGGGRTPARPFVKTNYSESSPRFSPDGRWIAYQSNESGRFEIYVRSYPDGETIRQVSTDGGSDPVWPSRGTDLLYRGTTGMMMAAAITLSPEFTVGKPRALFDASRYQSAFDAPADGRRLLLMPLVANQHVPTQIHVVLNFLAELRERAW